MGPSYLSTVLNTELPVPEARHAMVQGYPNPFRSVISIDFTLEQPSHVQLSIYDLLGREIATLMDGPRSLGDHSVLFDGAGLAPGVYFVVIEVDGPPMKQTLIKH